MNLHRLLALLLCITAAAFAQTQQPAQTEAGTGTGQEEETIRINTELIQTGVSVTDSRGRFVDGLRQEDFELRVDGKPVPVSFFERVKSNTGGGNNVRSGGAGNNAENSEQEQRRGRVIAFVVDDLHLSFSGHARVKEAILKFIGNEMRQDDLLMIASPSGKIGFLQQFTDNADVLRAAVERLKFNEDTTATDYTPPPMTAYEALLIDRYDVDVTKAFARAYVSLGLANNEEEATAAIRMRARDVLHRAATFSRRTYDTLERAVRLSSRLRGRKIFFLLSEGFFLDPVNTDSTARLHKITDAAARSNCVVYSIDARGLDADFPTGTAASFRVRSGELWEGQDPLNAVAESTGGRLIRNTNDLFHGVTNSVEEASTYYLLAWRPDTEAGGEYQFRHITVGVKGRPELKVKVHSGYFGEPRQPANSQAQAPARPPTPEEQLRTALGSMVPKRALPTSLGVSYLDTPEDGGSIAGSVEINSSAISFTESGERRNANVDLVAVVFDDQGKQAALFRERLPVVAPASASARPGDVYYNFRAKLKPGLYQVRVAARDERSGLAGSAAQWVEVADLSKRKLALSSLLLGELSSSAEHTRPGGSNDTEPAAAEISVSRRFRRASRLRYVVYVYNASAGQSGMNVSIQTEIFRGSNPIVTAPPHKLSPYSQDPLRIPYAAEFSLEGMPRGRYSLQVTVVDDNARTSARRRVSFEID